jgi:organic hydroperoxide reductase OsmC/OhrA
VGEEPEVPADQGARTKEDQAEHFHLTAGEEDRATVERVLKVYVDSCPVARSIKNSIDVSSELHFTAS